MPAEMLRQWIEQNRANAQTLVQIGGQGGWKPLGSIPDFADLFPPPTPAPPLAGSIRTAPPTHSPPAPPRTNSLAITGLVLSSLGLGCCPPLICSLGLIFSVVALVQINSNPATEGGKGFAVAGIIIAVTGFIFSALLTASGVTRRVLEEFLR